MVGHVLALLALFASGYSFVRRHIAVRELALRLALAHLCGAAALAMGVTLGLVVVNQVSAWWGGLGLAVLAAVGFVPRRDPVPPVTEEQVRPAPLSRLEWVLALMVAFGVATALARVVLLPLDWDGWAIWQFKAHAMVDGSLRELLTSPKYGYAHPDYPLLNPSNTWWLSAGKFGPKLAQVSGFLFFLDLLALFYHWGRTLSTRCLALAGCLVLVSWPLMMKHTASGFSDVPLAAYVLATALYLSHGQLLVGSLCLIGALLTKNEGLFTLLGATLLVLNGCLLERSIKPSRAAFVVGAGALAAISWAVMKRRWALNADLLDPSRWPKDLFSTLVHRIPGILRGFVHEAAGVGPRYPGWGLFWPVALVAIPTSARQLKRTVPLLLMCAAHLVGIITAYVVTPLDLSLHLSRSLDRLLLHFAPTLLLVTLIALDGLGKRAPDAV
jgi:hypothetical protein